MRETPIYVLTVAPGGPKFQGNDFPFGMMSIGPGMMQASGGREARQALVRSGGTMSAAQGAQIASSHTAPCLKNPGRYGNPDGPGPAGTCQHFTFLNQFMDRVATAMFANFFAGRIVVNRTGIQEKVSFAIDWEVGVPGQLSQPRSLTELSKSLEPVGLQLKEDPKGQVEFFVIDRAEKPTEN